MALRVLPSCRMHSPEEITDEKTACGDGKGCGHVGHGPLARLHPGLAHDLQAVGDRLDARVRSCAHGIGPQKKGENADEADGAQVMVEVAVDARP